MGKNQIKELSVSVMIYLDYSTGKHYKSLGYFLFSYQMASALKVQMMKKSNLMMKIIYIQIVPMSLILPRIASKCCYMNLESQNQSV